MNSVSAFLLDPKMKSLRLSEIPNAAPFSPALKSCYWSNATIHSRIRLSTPGGGTKKLVPVLPQFVGKGHFCDLSANLPEFVGQQSMGGPTMSKNHLKSEALTTDLFSEPQKLDMSLPSCQYSQVQEHYISISWIQDLLPFQRLVGAFQLVIIGPSR